MPLTIGVDGVPEGEGPESVVNRPLVVALGEPGFIPMQSLRDRSFEVGRRARDVLDRSAAPFAGNRSDQVLVAPALLENARDDPLGIGAKFVERAVSTLIASALGARFGSWSESDTQAAFATAFGLDPPSVAARDEILGQPLVVPDGLGGETFGDRFEEGFTLSPDPGGDLPQLGDDLRPYDDLFQKTCLIGVFQSMHRVGLAVSSAPRESQTAHIDELVPDHGCAGDEVTIRGTGFGEDPATFDLVLMFPAFRGGWIAVEVAPVNWSDTVIHAVAPEGVGTGPVGFIEVPHGAAVPLQPAIDDFVGEVGACLGPGAQLHAQDTFGKLGAIVNAAITETRTNIFRGGPPRIDYFLANGALSTIVRPSSTLRLQWSAINANDVTVRAVVGGSPEQPQIPAGALPSRGEIDLPVPGGPEWAGSYEIVAANRCGDARASVDVEMRSTAALAFAGGGSKGAFEVGAVRCLFDVFGYSPGLLVGASVGSLNAAKLAEGPAALPELEQLWKDMMGPEDLFYVRGEISTILTQLGPDIRNLLQLTPLEDLIGWAPEPTSTAVLNLNVAGRALSWGNSSIASAAGAGVFGTICDVLFTGLSIGLTIGKIVQAIQQLLLRPSLLLFDPVEDKIQANIDPAKVTASGLQLRLVVNGLRTGRVRYVNGSGAFVDGGPAPGLRNALTASAAIPIAFPPVHLPDGEDYVDGGVLENAPIEAAVRAGADEVIAILPSPAEISQPPTPPSTLFPVTLRAFDLLLDGSSRRQIQPYRGWGVPVKIIAPRFELHNLLAVDPGLIRINMDYGYMRAYDEMQDDDSLRLLYRASSDAIAAMRKEIWYQEHWANGQYPKGFQRTGQIQPTGSAAEVLWIRDKKREVRQLVLDRLALAPGTRESAPADIDKAWREWEAHFFDTYIASPWGGWSDYPGPVLQPETAPPPLP